MGRRPLRPCRAPGCRILVPGGYCPAHQPEKNGRSERAASWRWMYATQTWDGLRSAQLLKEPFCRACAARGLRVRATDVDHIRDHKGDWTVFTDERNLQSLCHSCHSRKTAQELHKSRTENKTDLR